MNEGVYEVGMDIGGNGGVLFVSVFFFFKETATTEIYTLSLHDALPIFLKMVVCGFCRVSTKMVCGSAFAGSMEN